MKKPKNKLTASQRATNMVKPDHTDRRLYEISTEETDAVLSELNTSLNGLSEDMVEQMRDLYGSNKVTHGRGKSLLNRLFESFINPFTIILIVLAAVSFVTDVVLAEAGAKNPITVIIIFIMVMISGFLRFVQETRSGNAAERLSEMVKTTTAVERQEIGRREILLEEVVVGDII